MTQYTYQYCLINSDGHDIFTIEGDYFDIDLSRIFIYDNDDNVIGTISRCNTHHSNGSVLYRRRLNPHDFKKTILMTFDK